MALSQVREKGKEIGYKLKMSIILLSHMANDGYVTILTPILSEIKSEFGLSPIEMGLIMSIYSFAGSGMQMPVSFLADYTGRKKTILSLGLVLSAIGVMGYGFSAGYVSLLFFVLVAGIGSSSYHPTGMAMITDELGRDRKGFSLGIFTVAGSLGSSLMPFAMGFLALYSWRLGAKILALPALITGVLIYLLFPEGHVENRSIKKTLIDIKDLILLNPPVLLIASFGGIVSLIYFGSITFLPLYMTEVYGWNPVKNGLFIGLFHSTAIVSQPLLGYLNDRYDGKKWLMVAGLAGAAALSLLVAFPSVMLTVFFGCIVGAAVLGVRPLVTALATDYTNTGTSSSTIGFLFMINTAFGALSPILGGTLQYYFSIQVVLVIYSILLLLGMLTLLPLKEKDSAR